MGLTHAQAQPVGASVIAGQAQVLSSGATTMVNQNSAKAIINWQDFSVGAGASVQFNQPNASSITLNRVTGSNLSTIDGAIRANGQVWLLNPNGVLFGNNARINVGGLLATTSDLANQDFLGGRYNFSGGNGEIVNNGQIRVRDGGSVVLSAPRVTNRGLIAARAGRVVLGGTDTFTVDFNGDRLLSYAVGASSQTGSVTNSGTVQAQGGRVLMTARAASGVQDAVINNSGMAEATSARSVNGEIILDAGEGTATNAGTLDASGKTAFETGGTVKVLGRLAAVPDNAVIDVSGNAGGGTVMIGGNFQGRGLEQHAQATTIGKATINADAIVRGNGGQVAVWSDGRTDVSGSITARGGAGGGNGGQVETSGHDLNITGSAYVSARAFQGKAGIWLLDPHNINITNSGTDNPNQAFGSSPMVDANVNPATIAAVLQAGTDVTMQAATDIIFLNDLTSTTGIAGATLTLQAGRTISLGTNSINIPLSNLVMIANDPGGVPTGFRDAGTAFIGTISGTITAARLDLIMSAGGTPGTIGSSSTPLIVLGATPTYISTPNTDAWISTGTSGVFHFAIGNTAHTNGVEIGTGNLNLVVNGSQQTAPILANNVTVTLPSGVTSGNPVNWDNAGNAFNGTVSITATNLSFTAQGNNAIALNASPNVIGAASLSAGTNILLYNTGNLTLNKVQGTSVNIQTTGTLTLATPATGATITASDFTVLHAGASILGNSGAVIASPTVSLIADTGTIGALGQPVGIATNNFAARTANRDIIVTATQFNNNPNTITTISGLSTAASGMIASTAVSGVNAGSGNAFLNGGAAVNWRNFSSAQVTNSIFANQLRISGASVTLTGVNISALTSFVSGGDLSISAARGFEIFDGAGAFGLLVTNGSIFLNANGSIGQAQGQAGTISASGTFNASATFLSGGGIFLNNTLNKVGGAVTLNAPGNILFYNAVNIASLLAGSPSGGEIDITSGGNINIGNSLDGGPAIRTSGNVELTAESGFIIQSSGASGAIKAGTLSSFGGNGNTLDNAANAISGRIEFGSLGNATLVNSITTNLGIALAGGTLTVQSGGDLVLLAGPTIAARLRSNDITIDNPNVRAQVTLAQLAGNIVSTKVGGDGIILAASGNFINNAGATALFLPGGARFLIYSTDPAANVFGNVRTPNAGIFGTTYPAAITAAGNRYIFTVASSTNNSFQGGDGLSLGGSTAASPDLIGFVTAGRPPPRQPPPPPPLARADILQILGNRPPPPPPPPPRNSPLAELAGPEANAEPPSSSDQATSFVASSLEGGLPPVTGSAGGGTIIPRYLTAQPILPSGTLEDPSLLPAFGNLSLWQ